MPNPYTTRRPSRPPVDAMSVLCEKGASIAATTATTPIRVETSHMQSIQAIVYANAYTAYVKDTAEWRIVLECAVTATGPFVALGSACVRSSVDGFSSAISVSSEEIQNILPGALFFRCNAVRVGAPGPLIYGAYLAPSEDS